MEGTSYLIGVVFTLIAVFTPTGSYRIVVDALSEECYYDRLESGAKLNLIYEVIDGGFLDVDVAVTKPDGTVIFARKGDSSGKVFFVASEPGAYTYCFSNRMSTVTPKEIKFSIDVGEAEKPMTDFGDYSSQEKEEINPEKLEVMIRELRGSIHGILHEQEYVEVRDVVHRRIQDSTNFRVTLWTFFESGLIAVVAIAQVYYIKQFFEVRRIV